MSDKTGIEIVARNRQATRNYHILEKMEAGIVLLGPEVKSIREGKIQLRDAYARLSKKGELWLADCRIEPYTFATHDPPDPLRQRKLLVHKRQIKRLIGKLHERGMSLIPLCIYFKSGKAKIELGLATGRTGADKRDRVKDRETQREIQREFKGKIKV